MRVLLPVCIVVSLLGVVAAAAAGCGGVALPPGALPGPVSGAPAGACSADGTYFTVTAADCGFLNCPGTSPNTPAYALCDGTSFSACTCTKPGAGSGWTVINHAPSGDSGMFKTYDTYVPPPPKDTGVDSTVDSGGGGDTGPSDTGTKDAPPG